MFTSFHRAARVAVVLLVLTACGQEPTPPAGQPALARPLLTLDAQPGQVLVPEAVVTVRGGVPGVLVMNREHLARFRMVRTGKTRNGYVQILSGLNGDETLIAGDLADVRDGSPITPMTSAR